MCSVRELPSKARQCLQIAWLVLRRSDTLGVFSTIAGLPQNRVLQTKVVPYDCYQVTRSADRGVCVFFWGGGASEQITKRPTSRMAPLGVVQIYWGCSRRFPTGRVVSWRPRLQLTTSRIVSSTPGLQHTNRPLVGWIPGLELTTQPGAN